MFCDPRTSFETRGVVGGLKEPRAFARESTFVHTSLKFDAVIRPFLCLIQENESLWPLVSRSIWETSIALKGIASKNLFTMSCSLSLPSNDAVKFFTNLVSSKGLSI